MRSYSKFRYLAWLTLPLILWWVFRSISLQEVWAVIQGPARRELVRWITGQGLSERRALRMLRMSASALRYEPRPDRNTELREKIVRLAQRHRRYGAGMIYLKLRQRRTGQPQAGRSALRQRATAGEASATQEDPSPSGNR